MFSCRSKALSVALVVACAPFAASAQDANVLAKQLSNPIANLTSVPFQFTWDDGFGARDEGHRLLLNMQPVVPVSIGTDWSMISRTIVPVVYQDDVVPGHGAQFGLGDTTQSLFFSPKVPTDNGWTWGVGPALLIPTATENLLGTDQWAAGPTIVALRQTQAGWTYGVLANHLWSFAGDDNRANVDQTFLQPFVAKALGQGRTLSFNAEAAHDHNSSQWSVPFNAGYSKVTRWGTQMVSWQVGVRYWVETPTGGPDWGLRFTATLLYPRR